MINNTKVIELYQSIAESNEDRVFEAWHASSISMCPRAHYYKRLAIPELTEVSGAKVIRWSAGHHLETAIRPIIEKVYGKSASNERMTSLRLQLTGEFDNLIVHDNRLVEIKSVSDFAFISRENVTSLKEATGKLNKWNKPEYATKHTPYLGHELQNHAYVILLREKGIKVEEIDYVYISLSGRLVVYSTQVQQELIDNVERRLEALNKAWKTKTPPPCICTESHPLYDSVMRWCPYKTETECCSLDLIKEVKDDTKK